jgi:hypothetical protein
MTQHNSWTPGGKTVHLIAAHIQYCVPTVTTYEKFTAALENRYWNHHLAEKFHAELMRRERHARKSLQGFAAYMATWLTVPMPTQINITSVWKRPVH